MSPAAAAISGPAPALQARCLSRRFGGQWAVVQVDLSLAAGEGLLVAGRNGSGKSTLLRLLSGALRADRGAILVEGSSDRSVLLARSALLGHSSGTYEPLTALENLSLFARLLGKPSDRRSLLSRLDEVGLSAHADSLVGTFSAGMHQRLSLARLLLQDPAVALLDEPHSALDPEGRRLVDALIARMKRAGTAVVLASHDLRRAAASCERAVLLDAGRIQWSGPAAELLMRHGADPAWGEGAL
ncbi:MAG TPA: heme ABC exporter ATP-binding protein CcmA [Myxococcales bacterium]|jgi:heme ABC exporter ATP-binding subunit CcmA